MSWKKVKLIRKIYVKMGQFLELRETERGARLYGGSDSRALCW